MTKAPFPIPQQALQQHILVLGKTRSGKSSAMRAGFVEPLLERNKPVCIIDPKGDWWGIKSSADGQGRGYPVVIFGGDHGDVPINEHSGKPVAELVATGNRPCLIDLKGWMVGKRTRFFIDFSETLFRLNRGELWLVIDECHNFAPQGSTFRDPDSAIMLHWSNRLASEGLGLGINLVAASQRPQKVHKDFVTSFETLLAMKVIHKLDRDAVKDWIDGCGDPALGKQILGELAGLARGEAWVWSPEIDFGPKRMQFKMFRTYDSFKPRRRDEKALKGWADVDLEEVKEKLATVVAQAEANDPKALKRRIAELERELKKKPVAADTNEVIQLRVQIADLADDNKRLREEADGHVEQLVAADALFKAALDGSRALVSVLEKSDFETPAKAAQEKRPMMPRRKPDNCQLANKALNDYAEEHRRAVLKPSRAQTSAPVGANGKLGKGEVKVLTAIAQHEEGVDRRQLSVLTGYKRSSRDTYIQRLVSAGLVDVGPPIEATAEGLAVLGSDFEPVPTGEALQAYWLQRLSGGEQAILQVLVDAHPEPVSRDQISDITEYKRSSRDTYIQRLRSRQLVTMSGAGVSASDTLF